MLKRRSSHDEKTTEEPQRKSARLEQDNNRAAIPSPSASLEPPHKEEDPEPEPEPEQQEDSQPRPQQVQNTSKPINPIEHWAISQTWPQDFANMSTPKRQRTPSVTESGIGRPRSYSQERREGLAPEQYSKKYQERIVQEGIYMDRISGDKYISEESKHLCRELKEATATTIWPTIFPQDTLPTITSYYENRNEAIVFRDITPLIIPPIRSLYTRGHTHLEHVIDEVNADWHKYCFLYGPQLRPDLSIGLAASAFTDQETEKLRRFSSVNNWTQVTDHIYFPFLMCEVKGRHDLDIADRQNMHSCSVAVRTIIRLEEEADKYRPEPKAEELAGQVVAFSISHSATDARLYGHFARPQNGQWLYHRYAIQKYDLADYNGMLALYGFVQNILKNFLPTHLERIKGLVGLLPEPVALSQSQSSQLLGSQDEQGFAIPAIPNREDSSVARLLQQLRDDHKMQMDTLQQQQVERDAQTKIQMDALQQQMREQAAASKEREERLLEALLTNVKSK